MRAKVATFLYHEVIDRQSLSGFQAKSAQPYKHSKKEFLEFLDLLDLSPVKPVKFDQIDVEPDRRNLLLTFDDGGTSNLYIADELERRGWFGHFFIPTNFIGTKYFLSPNNIRELKQRGHAIGSHSHSHASPFYLLSDEEMVEEWKTSIRILSEITQDEVYIGSIPGGEMDKRTQLLAQKSGLKFLFTSLPTLKPRVINGMIVLGRVCPKAGTDLRLIENFVNFKSFPIEMAKWSTKRVVRRALVQFTKQKPSPPKDF